MTWPTRTGTPTSKASRIRASSSMDFLLAFAKLSATSVARTRAAGFADARRVVATDSGVSAARWLAAIRAFPVNRNAISRQIPPVTTSHSYLLFSLVLVELCSPHSNNPLVSTTDNRWSDHQPRVPVLVAAPCRPSCWLLNDQPQRIRCELRKHFLSPMGGWLPVFPGRHCHTVTPAFPRVLRVSPDYQASR